MSGSEYLLKLFWKAAEKDAAFAQYLYGQVKDRMESGRSTDCDEYLELMRLAKPSSHCEWKHECKAPFCDCGLANRTWADEEADLKAREAA